MVSTTVILMIIPLTLAAPYFKGRFPPMGPPPGGMGGMGGPGGPGMPGVPFMPPPPRELPPGFTEILPADVVAKLRAIHENDMMPPHEKHENIDEIMVNLPEEVAERLPKPPGFENVPEEVRQALKNIHRDKNLSYRTRMERLHQYIASLPDSTRRLLPPLGPPPVFEQLPQEVKEQLRSIHENMSLGPRERFHKIKEVIDSLPEDIRSKLPPPPPAPPVYA